MGTHRLSNNYLPPTDPYAHQEQADFDLWFVDFIPFFCFTDSRFQAIIDVEVRH